jgi:hypothetical protein
MPGNGISVVETTKKKCKPFVLEVMVMSPEAGYKFEVYVERACTPEKEAIWKLVFELYKKIDNEFVQVVHVSYRAAAEPEEKGIEGTAVNGVSLEQARLLVNDVHPAVKEVTAEPTPEQKERIRKEMQRVALANVEV